MLFKTPSTTGPNQTRLFEAPTTNTPSPDNRPQNRYEQANPQDATHWLEPLRREAVAQVPKFVRCTPKGTPITSSRKVALCFQKEHKHVLRDIRELQSTILSLDTDEPMCFADHLYKDANGQMRPEIVMTERGFMLLAMGFTGREAVRFKMAFLDAFEAAKAKIPAMPVPVSMPDEYASHLDINRVAQLAYYTREEMQVECVKQVSSYVLINAAGGKGTLIYHHRQVMRLLTGETPSEYRQARVDEQHRVKSLSGRQLLRRFEPAKAAAAAVLDDAVRMGTSIQELEQSGAAETLPQAFTSLLALGLNIADLSDSK